MRIIKWIIFFTLMIITIVSLVIVYLMYSNLSFIDYPYLYLGSVTLILSIIVYKKLLKKV